MTDHELKMLIKTLKGFFPEATGEQALLIAETAKGMHYSRALAVLKTHKRLHDFFSVKVLTEALVSDHDKCLSAQHQSKEQKVIEWLRMSDPHTLNYLAFTNGQATDLELLHRHFDAATSAIAAKCEDPVTRDETAKIVRGHAVIALRQIGFADAEADELAREWAGMPQAVGVAQT